jgi:beta-glucosidase
MHTSRRKFLFSSISGLAVLARGANSKPRFFSQYDPDVRKLLAQMTLDEKIGQMTQPDQMYLQNLDDIDKYHLGSLLSGGDSDPKTGNDLTSWTDMYDRYQERALKTRLRIPLLYGVDAVHGHNNVIGAVVFPHNVALGCTRDPKLIEQAARITSEEVKATGINWAFAPCVTVPQDIRWGRTYEGFSEDPDIVKVLGEAANRGLQRDRLDDRLAVLGCAKHYIGDGGTTFGTGQPKGNSGERFPLDQGDTRVDEATLRKIHLPGYLTTIAGGVGTIMPSYSSWNGVKCSASKRLMTDLLKQELGFEGFLISDYGALNQLPGDYKQQIETSINAGMDMVMVPEKYVDFFNNLKALVTEGRVPLARVDDAVTRILRTKLAMGMMNPKNPQLADRSLHKNFGSADHRAVAREAVRKSLVVLKNDNKLLPLSKNVRVHVAGKGHNDIGIQCGGWTITWQGGAGPVTKGTTILEGIHKAVAPSTVVSHSADGSQCEGAKVGIAVIGEMPYAEMMGDRTDLRLAPEDIAVVDRMKSAGLRVVVVLLSGRPIFIDNILGKADAIIAAWLPGTEGDGVADVLFGDYKPTGKLAFTWPKDSSSSLHRGDPGYQARFPLGHGLSS